MSNCSVKPYYVPQLDGLRFFAFFLVFVHHFNFPISELPFLDFYIKAVSFVREHGWIGVDLFLVLSSFLITNLLLMEYRRDGRISLKDFYMRRTLRIWPLYYLVVFVGFFANPMMSGKFFSLNHQAMMDNHLVPYVLFLGNFSAGIDGYAGSRFLAHLWTISLEEQFYILWPLLLVLFLRKKQHLYIALLVLLCMTFALRYYYVASGSSHPWIWTSFFTRLDPLILGSVLALYRENNSSAGQRDVWKYVFGVLLLVLPTFFARIEDQTLHVVWQYFSIAAGFCLIIDASLSGRVKFVNSILTNYYLVWLGKLCYGLYVYHLFTSNLGKKITRALHLDGFDVFSWFFAFFLSLSLTVLLSWLSYRYIEKYFLKLKNKFTHVQSRPE